MQQVSLARTKRLLLLAVLSVVVLYYGRPFLIPLAFAAVLAMLLTPVGRRLERWGLSRGWSTLGCLLLAFVGAAGWVIGAQAANISEQLPQMQQKLQQGLQQAQQWIKQQFGVAPQEQLRFVQEQISKFSQSANRYLTGSLAGLLGGFVLVLLYLFFLL